MDSKVPLDEPPPYTASPTSNIALDEPHLNPLTSHLQHHVSSLPDSIRATQRVRRAEQMFSDASLLDHIVPIVEEFLADLGARHTPVSLATLTLVPNAAVPKNSVLSGVEDMKRRGELSRVSRVSVDSKGKDAKPSSRSRRSSEDPSWPSGREFSDWGRFGEERTSMDDVTEKSKLLWWRDEEMAQRLASYLQPKREDDGRAEQRSAVQDVVEQRIPPKKEKKGWAWGRRRSEQTPSDTQITRPAENETIADKPQEKRRQCAEMAATAQEVAFRHENEFGIWESFNGWGIVVAVEFRT
ncbi:hypothetical protein AAE478_005289 [Parahypoxylon ruwenzoriense]